MPEIPRHISLLMRRFINSQRRTHHNLPQSSFRALAFGSPLPSST